MRYRPQIAEWVIGTWISHLYGLNHYSKYQDNEDWHPKTDMRAFGTDSVGRRM